MCQTCAWAHVVKGYRESEMVVICTDVSPNIQLAFKVRECGAYLGRDRPSWDDMKALAINVWPAGSAKLLGFRPEIAAVEEPNAEVASEEVLSE